MNYIDKLLRHKYRRMSTIEMTCLNFFLLTLARCRNPPLLAFPYFNFSPIEKYCIPRGSVDSFSQNWPIRFRRMPILIHRIYVFLHISQYRLCTQQDNAFYTDTFIRLFKNTVAFEKSRFSIILKAFVRISQNKYRFVQGENSWLFD
jgi:hypothetical protein